MIMKLLIIFWILFFTIFVYKNVINSNLIFLISAIAISFVFIHKKKKIESFKNDNNINKWIAQIKRNKSKNDINHALIQLKEYYHSIDSRFNKKKLKKIINEYDEKEIYESNIEENNPYSIGVSFTRNKKEDILNF